MKMMKLTLVSGLLFFVGTTACTADTGIDESIDTEETSDDETGTDESALITGGDDHPRRPLVPAGPRPVLTKDGPSQIRIRSSTPNVWIGLTRLNNGVAVSAGAPSLQYLMPLKFKTQVRLVCATEERYTSYCLDPWGSLNPCSKTRTKETATNKSFAGMAVNSFVTLGAMTCPSGRFVEASTTSRGLW